VPRLFEVEAMRDGRLAGTQLASFARHVALCPVCAREAKALDQVADGLRASPPGTSDTATSYTPRASACGCWPPSTARWSRRARRAADSCAAVSGPCQR